MLGEIEAETPGRLNHLAMKCREENPRDFPGPGVSPYVSHPDPLSDLLKTWRHEPPAEPGFNAGVHARLARARPETNVVSFYRWALPLAASVALILGVGSAVQAARHQHADRMAAAYAQSIDPLQMNLTGARP
jgi:hypothetical protein